MADATGKRRRSFVWQFDSPAGAIWPVLADTARFNEAAELPKHEIAEETRSDGSVRYMARARTGPFAVVWEDHPANWVTGHWFRHARTFANGPLKSLTAHFALAAAGEGCSGDYTIEAEPANLLGRLILGTFFFAAAGRTFERLAADAREFAAGRTEREFAVRPPGLAPGATLRLAVLVEAIEETPYGNGLARRLADYVATRQEVDVAAIRPRRLARLWQVPERHAIEVCLQAAKVGLLALRWDLLCPRCQVGKATALALDLLPAGAHCPSCNIDYGRNFTRNVELVFQPSRAIRPVDGREYCLFGPMSTPHVRAQLTVEAGGCRAEAIDLPHGDYRARTLEPGGEAEIAWRGGGFPEIVAEGATIAAGAPAAPGMLGLRNRTGRRLTFIVEELEWRRDALTAHQVTTLQAFRDLFGEETLRPGDDVEIDHVAIMFTDLKGSTALYEAIGDSRAYHLVREHFAVLGKAVREHNGAIVKTIGDAIMGAFADPADGLRCAVRIHEAFAAFNATAEETPVTIKIGLHVGRCISVTLNSRLDYYGTAANKAARLEGESLGGDIVLSEEFAADPVVAPLLAPFRPAREIATLKGFPEPVPYHRIPADRLAELRRSALGSPVSA